MSSNFWWPSTWQEAIVVMVTCAILVALAFLVFTPGYERFIAKQWDADQAAFMHESAAFRARWPGERLWSAPYDEVKAEAVRCWRIIDILQQRNRKYQYANVAINNQAAEIHGWLLTVHQAMNVAAEREQHRWAGPYRR
ncbi:hypothetical protein [Mycolicibacterium thermoresistibile]